MQMGEEGVLLMRLRHIRCSYDMAESSYDFMIWIIHYAPYRDTLETIGGRRHHLVLQQVIGRSPALRRVGSLAL